MSKRGRPTQTIEERENRSRELEIFGNNLNKFMKEQRWQNHHIAAIWNIDPSTISHWRRCRNMPTEDKLPALANFLGKSVEELTQ